MPQKKIVRIQEKYDLDLDDRLAEDRRSGVGLRDLRDYINHRIAEAVVAGTPLSGDQIYRAITEDVGPKEYDDIDARLENSYADVSLNEVADDFVSHETVRKYLVDDLEVKPEMEPFTLEDAGETIDWSEQRHKSIIENQISRLATNIPEFSDDCPFEITVDVRIVRTDIGTVQRLDDFLEQNGC